jgi:hypothetical protein
VLFLLRPRSSSPSGYGFAHPDGLIVTVEELSSTVLLVMEGDIDLATRAFTPFFGSTMSALTTTCISPS